MASNPQLVVALEARLNKFESQMKEAGLIADRGVRQIEDKFARANPKLGGGFLTGLLGGAAGVLSIDLVAKSLQRVVGDLAKIGDQSQRVGVTAEQLQELQFALEQSGGEASQAGPALERFSQAISKASEGEGKLARFLEANNVSIKDREGKLRPLAELLGEVSNLIQQANGPQERLNIATAFFGNSAGPAMVTALANGASGLQALGAQAQGTGAIISNELIKKAKEIDDQWNALARTWGVTVKGAIISMIDAASEFSKKSVIAAALDSGTESAQQLAEAIQFARSKGSPVDPGWITQLERLLELQREANKAGGFSGKGTPGSTLPGVSGSGKPTNTSPLNTRDTSGSTDSFERAINQLEKRTAVLAAETAAVDLNAAARARARVVAELETAAKQANEAAGLKNTEVTDAQRLKIEELAAAYEKVAIKAEDARSPLREFARDAADANKNIQNAAVQSLNSLEDGLVSIVTQAKTAKEAFRDMANAIIADLVRIAIRQAIIGPIAGALGGGFGLPGRAAGGPVSAGSAYVVGERGPEVFVPNSTGAIVPNSVASRSGAGAINVFVHSRPVFQSGVTPTDMAAIEAKMAQNDQMLRGMIVQDIRGGLSNDSSYLGQG